MKRACLTALTAYVCYLELSGDIGYWLPACGNVGGLGQTVVSAFLALIVFGSAVGLGYQVLCNIFD